MISRNAHNRRQQGFSLVEVLIVIVIVAIGIALIGPRITRGFAGVEANDEVQNLQSIFGTLRELRGPTGYGTASLVPALASRDALPGAWTYNAVGGTVTNPWGGAVTITGATNSVVVASANVPAPACNTIVSRLLSVGAIRTTRVNTVVIPATADAAAIATACGTGAAVNTIEWTTAS